jgi:diaminopimelate epimerase
MTTGVRCVRFSKYSGCGNDFILVDHRQPFFPLNDRTLIQKLCHRQLGIGADGIILLEPSSSCDLKMRIFNCDGSEAEMCGNGLRCFAQFIYELGFPKKKYLIQTMHQQLTIEPFHNEVKTSMGDPQEIKLDIDLPLDQGNIVAHYLDTGVPHAVIFVDEIEKTPVTDLGNKIRFHSYFAPKGANANFVQKITEKELAIRTYERGVEAETLACGTGATASAVVAALKWQLTPPIAVKTRSRDTLTIDFIQNNNGSITHVTQTGPAVKHFHGEFLL